MNPRASLIPLLVTLATLGAGGSAGEQDPRAESAAVSSPGANEGHRDAATDHWAFQPVRRPPLPAVGRHDWVSTPIDRFVLARLEEERLTPSPRADRRTLARRAYFDLIGLPPTRAEIEAFLCDDAPDAFSRLVDRLLASPRYGERWGRHWLDIARYADTKGYVDAGEPRYPFAYTYRDYVIGALNEDLPYDRFVLEQLAADRLPERERTDLRALAALGFLTVGQRFNFFPHEIIDDRIDVVTRGFLALTATCARCHDHKYDPISMADYYGLYGVFASSKEPSPEELPVLSSRDGATEPESESDSVPKVPKEVREAARKYHDRRRDLHRQIQHELRARAGDYLRYIVQTNPEHRTLAQPPLRTERGLVRDVSAYARGGVIRWRRYIAERGVEDRVFGLWNRLVAMERDEVLERGPRILDELREAGEISRLVASAFEATPPRSMVVLADVYGRLLEETEALWRQRLESDSRATRFDDAAREELRQVLYAPDSPATMTVDESEDVYHLDESSDVRKRFADIERAFLDSSETLPRAMAVRDRERPIEPRVFERGDPDRPGRRVERRLPRLLSGVSDERFRDGSGRLELARGIVDEGNPLTARVIVNRVWAWHFGRGIVRTPGDFGARSSPPTHPELLDYLASWFVQNGWSLKELHRRILLSSTWQQASDDRPECRAVDAENTLLWRANRRRLGFEAMRDSMLAVAGRLASSAGGPPVRKAPDDPTTTVRTVYCLVDREKLPGVFRVFDFPSPDIHAPKRSRTTVPQQALFLLNSPFVIAQSEALAASLDQHFDPDDLEGRARHLCSVIHGRDPDPDELELARRFLRQRIAAVARRRSETPAAIRQWRHGFGEYDVAKGRLASFTSLPHFTGEAWQGGEQYPDAALHYLQLTGEGGHVGIDHAHAAVRRWIASRSGVVSIRGELGHVDEACGDGVRAWVASSRTGELGAWTVYKSRARTELDGIEVEAGDAIDFVVDCRENHFCDLFRWAPAIHLESASDATDATDDPAAKERAEWDAARDFGGPMNVRRVSSPWAEYAQALLQSNEFLFVD